MRSRTSLVKATAAILATILTLQVNAAPGDVLFEDGFERGFYQNWSISHFWRAWVGGHTSETGRRSLYLHRGAVSVTLRSGRVDLSGRGASLSFWVRRGHRAFSDPPESGEDLRVEYLDTRNRWQHLVTYGGGGQSGQIFSFSQPLPDEALHSRFSVRFALTSGSGRRRDFWHIDNVRVVETASARTAPRVVHDNSGFYCVDEPVRFQVVDPTGAVQTDFTGRVRVATDSGLGGWRVDSAAGQLNDADPNDGFAYYDFVAADRGEAALLLAYPSGLAVIDVDMTILSGGQTDDDAEGPLVFAPQGFVVTATPVADGVVLPINDPVEPQIAGRMQTAHVAAISGTCGVVLDYDGTKMLGLWQSYVDPPTGSRAIEVNGIAVGRASADAIRQPITFLAGRASVRLAYSDVGAVQWWLRDDDGALGSTDSIVWKPADLVITHVEDLSGTENPGASGLDGERFVAAGRAFRVAVEARSADGSVTPNFGREVDVEQVRLVDRLVEPAGGVAGELLNDDAFNLVGSARFENSDAIYTEVGTIGLRAEIADGDYLGGGPVMGLAEVPVGRFVADHFVLSSSRIDPSCDAFTYMREPALGLHATLEARSAVNTRVENFDQVLFGRLPLANVQVHAENLNDGVDLGGRLSFADASWARGEYDIQDMRSIFSQVDEPDGPFTDLSVSIAVTDEDGAELSSLDQHPNAIGDCLALDDCTSQTIGQTEIYFGRLQSLAVQGPEDKNLSVPLRAEVWDQGFREFDQDNCSVYDTASGVLSDFTDALDEGETSLVEPLESYRLQGGVAVISQRPTLSGPGVGNHGTLNLTVAAPVWLQFDWHGDGAASPSARATFGSYRGHDKILVWQEVIR
ncbi:MAG: hypothetical protein GKR90_11775 [Pseudomonadales bacterium]|nr:hypothetical protein [Pseudomonadales bacterium]